MSSEKNETTFHLDKSYKTLLSEIKEKVRSSRLQIAITVNQEVIKLYWYIGKQIVEKQKTTNWGDRLINTLSNDLRNSFPETSGFSPVSLKRMRMFAEYYPDIQIGSQAVTQLPWGHIQLLLFKIKNGGVREWYASQCLENGWSRPTLERYIRNSLFEAQGIKENKATNFLTRLPLPQSHLAQDLIKNPYNFDFLGLHDQAHEREFEHASVQHITKFMLELGKGFAFVGNQVPITIEDQEFFIDMLFYNLKLRCYVITEIKSVKFKPEHIGQLNFYLSAVDDLMSHPDDNPSIGLLLCKSRNKIIAEYALKSVEKPIGISEYELTKTLPDKLKDVMPTVKELEAELSDDEK